MLSNMKQTKWLFGVFFFAIISIIPTLTFAQAIPADRVVVKFLYDGDQSGSYEVVSVNHITKVIPPSDKLPTDDFVSGFYYELQSAAGTVIYRRIMNNPIPLVAENPGEPSFERKSVIPQEKTFSILIPRANAGDILIFFSSPLDPGKQIDSLEPQMSVSSVEPGGPAEAALEVARINLIQ
jgi:hypothetical protein